jgi:DNA-binding XRE family transcriptional regulator
MFGYSTFGVWLKAHRRLLGLTQDEFGKLVFCAAITLRKIESDQLRPSRELALSIVDKIGVAPEERELIVRWARNQHEPIFVEVMGNMTRVFATQD